MYKKKAAGVEDHFRPHYHEGHFTYWCQLMFGLLIFLRNKLQLCNISHLLTFVIEQNLFPSHGIPVSSNFESLDNRLLNHLSMALGFTSESTEFVISPPSNPVCTLHWKILSSVTLALHSDERAALHKTSFPLPLPKPMHLGEFDGSFIDSHCHMDKIFKDSGLQSFIKYLESSCYRQPVLQFCVCNFVYPVLWTYLKEIRDCIYSMRCTVGIHPHFIETGKVDNQIDDIIALVSQGDIVGLGEVGVDYTSRCHCGFLCEKGKSCLKVKAQKTFLQSIVPVAASYNLPLVLHCRGRIATDGRAAEDVRKLVADTGYTKLPIHRHCFIGNMFEMHKWLDTFPNVMFGFTKRSLEDPDTCASLSYLSIDKVLLETDSQYLDSPEPFSILDM